MLSFQQRHLFVAFVAALAMVCASAGAQTNVALIDPPIRIERLHETHVIELDGREVATFEISSKILKTQALERAKHLTLSYSRSAQKLEIVEAYTRKADNKRVPVPKSSWQMSSSTGQGSAAPIFSDQDSVALVFPDLAVGDSVVATYKISTREPLFPGKISLQSSFPPSIGYDDVRVVVDAPLSMKLQHVQYQMEESLQTKGARQIITWVWRNPDPIRNDRINWSVFRPDSQPGYALSSFSSWPEIAKSYVDRASPKATVTPAVKQLSDEIVAGAKDPTAQARALYDWVALNVHYVGNCVGIGAVVPRDLDVVLGSKIGDCKDHATLLQALLSAQGIVSQQVLVNASNLYELPTVPVASSVNHVINFIPQLSLFVDSTDGNTSFGLLPLSVQDKPVLAAQEGVPARTPHDPGGNTQTMHTVLTVGEDGTVRGKVSITVAGVLAAVARQQFRNLGKDDQARFVQGVFRQSGMDADGTVTFEDPSKLESHFSYAAEFTARAAVRFPGAGAININQWFPSPVPVSHFALQANAPTEEYENACFSVSSVEEYEITLPSSMQVLSVPNATAFNSPLISYESSYELKDHLLRVHRFVNDKSVGNVCSAEIGRQFKVSMQPIFNDVRQQLLYK